MYMLEIYTGKWIRYHLHTRMTAKKKENLEGIGRNVEYMRT